MKKYVEPEIKFEALQLEEPIANTCWAYSKDDADENADLLYYDTPGKGYVSFSVSGAGNCKGDNMTATLRKYYGVESETTANNALQTWFSQFTVEGNKGSSFQGTGYSEKEPDPKWS